MKIYIPNYKTNFLLIVVFLCSITISCTNDSDFEKSMDSEEILKSSSESNELEQISSNDPNLQEFVAYVNNNESFNSRVPQNSYISTENVIAIDEVTELGTKRVYITTLYDETNAKIGAVYGFKNSIEMLSSFPEGSNEYAMILELLVDFETPLQLKNGIVKSYDLNYDAKFLERNYVDGTIQSTTKYPVLGNLDPVDVTVNNWEDDCRGGSNGNVSWGECMGCLRGACAADNDCNDMMVFVDRVTWGSGHPHLSTWGSMGASCVVISWMY